MRAVWARVFGRIDSLFDTDMASNPFLLNVAPFFPVMALGLLFFLGLEINTQFSWGGGMGMGFLHD